MPPGCFRQGAAIAERAKQLRAQIAEKLQAKLAAMKSAEILGLLGKGCGAICLNNLPCGLFHTAPIRFIFPVLKSIEGIRTIKDL